MSAKETHNEAVQITSHYWGYREMDPTEFKHVGGGYDGGDDGSGAESSGTETSDTSGSSNQGGRGCTAADTQASCNARQEGYGICDTLNLGLGFAANLGGWPAETLQAEFSPFCRNAVDRAVDAAYRTQMWEQRNMSFSGSNNYDGGSGWDN
jgi:hypothetical protein